MQVFETCPDYLYYTWATLSIIYLIFFFFFLVWLHSSAGFGFVVAQLGIVRHLCYQLINHRKRGSSCVNWFDKMPEPRFNGLAYNIFPFLNKPHLRSKSRTLCFARLEHVPPPKVRVGQLYPKHLF